MFKKLKRLFIDPQFARKRDFLRGLGFCSGLTEREVGILLQALHARTYREGEILFTEGDIGRALFILESGKVELTRQNSQRKPQRLAILDSGSFFGEMALLEQLPRTASAIALEKCSLFLLYRSKLDEILYYHPRIGVSLMTHFAQLLSARLRKSWQKAEAAPEA